MAQAPQCPPIDASLIEHLKHMFQGKIPAKEETLFTYGTLRGHQEVIEHLQKKLREQEASKGPLNVLKQT
jgi:hypothetical protein